MNLLKIKSVTGLLAGACLLTTVASQGAEFWLRTGIITNTMPDGRLVPMWAFAQDSAAGANDGVLSVPGPQLNVAAGDSLVIHVTNSLPEPVSLIVPGQYAYDSLDPVFQSGGPYDGRVRSWTREAAPGGTADYRWSSVQSGTFLYYSGSHASIQVQMGLYGALAVTMAGPAAYTAVPFDSAVTLLFSEIDPEVHDAVAAGTFGPGPDFMPNDFTDASAAALVAQITASADPFAMFIAAQLVNSGPPNTPSAGALVADLSAITGGPCIYDPLLLPDSILSPATLAQFTLEPPPSMNQPTSDLPFKGDVVRLNRLLLQDGFAAIGISNLPVVKTMTSTIRSYPQYFLINGQPYTNGLPPIAAGKPGSRILLRFLNAGMDAREPALNNGGDLQLLSEDGQQSPYPRLSSLIWLPALKTIDAIWNPSVAGTYTIYDRRLGVANALLSPGGMIVKLAVAGTSGGLTAPAIVIQPTSQTVQEFSSVNFTVVATGSGLTYQWRSNAVPIAGATSATYTLPSVSLAANGSVFSVVVSGTGGPSVTSANATLTVTAAPPTITTQPATHNLTPPASTTFTVVATGSAPLSYQWQKATAAAGPFAPLANSPHISGATAGTLTILSPTATSDGGFYSVVVSNSAGSVTSAVAELRAPPAITTQPASQVRPDLTTATFSVVAAGSSLTYQWQRWSGSVFTNIPGATAASYSLVVHYLADNGAQFRVVVFGSGGPSVTSSSAALTVTPVNSVPQIAQQPVSVFTNAGAANIAFSVVAYGWPTPSYAWQRWNGSQWITLANNATFSGVTNSTLIVRAAGAVSVADAGNYRVQVVNRINNIVNTVNSAPAGLTITETFAGSRIRVPASATGGPVSPYPSTTSNNIPAFTGATVKHVTVSLTITHPELYDLSALLVTPGTSATRRKVEFMANVGPFPMPGLNGAVLYSYGVTNATLVFDDDAAAQVSTLFPVQSNTTNNVQPTLSPLTTPTVAGSFPSPAPGLPYVMALNGFYGYAQTTAARWSLYVADVPPDVRPAGTSGTINWSQTLTVGP